MNSLDQKSNLASKLDLIKTSIEAIELELHPKKVTLDDLSHQLQDIRKAIESKQPISKYEMMDLLEEQACTIMFLFLSVICSILYVAYVYMRHQLRGRKSIASGIFVRKNNCATSDSPMNS